MDQADVGIRSSGSVDLAQKDAQVDLAQDLTDAHGVLAVGDGDGGSACLFGLAHEVVGAAEAALQGFHELHDDFVLGVDVVVEEHDGELAPGAHLAQVVQDFLSRSSGFG